MDRGSEGEAVRQRERERRGEQEGAGDDYCGDRTRLTSSTCEMSRRKGMRSRSSVSLGSSNHESMGTAFSGLKR